MYTIQRFTIIEYAIIQFIDGIPHMIHFSKSVIFHEEEIRSFLLCLDRKLKVTLFCKIRKT